MKKTSCKKALLISVVSLLVLSGCYMPRRPATTLTITNPTSAATLALYQEIYIISQIRSEDGWGMLELYINGELIRFDTSADRTQKFTEISQPWIPTSEGPTLISLIAYDSNDKQIAAAEVAVLVSATAAT
ncbi:MAG: hypothetical protein WA110_00830, partial [Anaerolineaceae bacterium]